LIHAAAESVVVHYQLPQSGYWTSVAPLCHDARIIAPYEFIAVSAPLLSCARKVLVKD
jgi:hypothetical protein